VEAVLDKVNGPEDLKRLSTDELTSLCEELRSLIVKTVSRTGGHLAANLGVVELTVALLKVFDPPADRIVWDVGHQAYAYKILTGRKARFHSLRQLGGISGFLKRSESEFDVFGAGHSGTALSAALGMAVARDRRQGREHVVAVIGDAGAGCGISLEALNNLAGTAERLIVVLNDNEMSIAENVGTLSRYLGSLLANPRYNRWKHSVESAARRLRMNWLRRIYFRVEEAVKGLFLESVIFEEFGLRYIGPIDGHSVPALVDALSIARDYVRPIILHVSTRKGKGYRYAEALPEKWHGTSAFDIESGEAVKPCAAATYSDVFGRVLATLAARDRRIVAITAAMPAGTGLSGFAQRFPDRFFDVGICEEHGVVFAAGLAAEGLTPVFAVYSTFSQRAVDCIIHDVCLQNLPVVICLDRAGVVGEDGPTHHGVFDIALLRTVPRLTIMQPADEAELARMLAGAVRLGRPAVIRYPRGAGPGVPVPDEPEPLMPGRAEVRRPGRSVQIWALGDLVPVAEEAAASLAAQGLEAGVVNARFVRPLDEDLLVRQMSEARVFVTLENGTATGGFGSAVTEFLSDRSYSGRIVRVGWPDQFVPQGAPAALMERFGLTAARVVTRVREALGEGGRAP